MPRRRLGVLLDLEIEILRTCLEAQEHGIHGFAIAKLIADGGDERKLTATGTLYRALHRLEAGGLIASEWEDPGDAAVEGRPRRRRYRITGQGASALAAASAASTDLTAATSAVQRGIAT